MNQLKLVTILMIVLPAFLLPARVNVCLTKGFGESCCLNGPSTPLLRGHRSELRIVLLRFQELLYQAR